MKFLIVSFALIQSIAAQELKISDVTERLKSAEEQIKKQWVDGISGQKLRQIQTDLNSISTLSKNDHGILRKKIENYNQCVAYQRDNNDAYTMYEGLLRVEKEELMKSVVEKIKSLKLSRSEEQRVIQFAQAQTIDESLIGRNRAMTLVQAKFDKSVKGAAYIKGENIYFPIFRGDKDPKAPGFLKGLVVDREKRAIGKELADDILRLRKVAIQERLLKDRRNILSTCQRLSTSVNGSNLREFLKAHFKVKHLLDTFEAIDSLAR